MSGDIRNRRGVNDAHKDAQASISDLLWQITEQTSGVLLTQTGVDGQIPVQAGETISNQVRQIVARQFVNDSIVSGAALQDELDHLQGLISTVRRDLRGGSTLQSRRAAARLHMLTDRYSLLAREGTRLDGLSSPYGRIVLGYSETAARAVVDSQAAAMLRFLDEDPDIVRWLAQSSEFDGFGLVRHNPLARYQPTTLWQDARGYTLSDRIWRVGEQTTRRIDALLRDGIAQGRSAVQIAKDLQHFLLPGRRVVSTKTPYGSKGSFDARRLARSEITRAASVASYVSGVTNPYVSRARYHLSGSHDPDNCDGTCDAHYAQDQLNGGFPPDTVPLPMLDTHPQCMCYITHEVTDQAAVTAALRQQYQEATTQLPPLTPLAREMIVRAVVSGLEQASQDAYAQR